VITPTGWQATAIQTQGGNNPWSLTAYVICGP